MGYSQGCFFDIVLCFLAFSKRTTPSASFPNYACILLNLRELAVFCGGRRCAGLRIFCGEWSGKQKPDTEGAELQIFYGGVEVEEFLIIFVVFFLKLAVGIDALV